MIAYLSVALVCQPWPHAVFPFLGVISIGYSWTAVFSNTNSPKNLAYYSYISQLGWFEYFLCACTYSSLYDYVALSSLFLQILHREHILFERSFHHRIVLWTSQAFYRQGVWKPRCGIHGPLYSPVHLRLSWDLTVWLCLNSLPPFQGHLDCDSDTVFELAAHCLQAAHGDFYEWVFVVHSSLSASSLHPSLCPLPVARTLPDDSWRSCLCYPPAPCKNTRPFPTGTVPCSSCAFSYSMTTSLWASVCSPFTAKMRSSRSTRSWKGRREERPSSSAHWFPLNHVFLLRFLALNIFSLCSYMTIIESLPTYGIHFYEVKVREGRSCVQCGSSFCLMSWCALCRTRAAYPGGWDSATKGSPSMTTMTSGHHAGSVSAPLLFLIDFIYRPSHYNATHYTTVHDVARS